MPYKGSLQDAEDNDRAIKKLFYLMAISAPQGLGEWRKKGSIGASKRGFVRHSTNQQEADPTSNYLTYVIMS